jgi:hypothetical protein
MMSVSRPAKLGPDGRNWAQVGHGSTPEVETCLIKPQLPRKVREHPEANRSAGLLLDDHRASSDFRSYHEVADFDLDEIAAAQLAVDG